MVRCPSREKKDETELTTLVSSASTIPLHEVHRYSSSYSAAMPEKRVVDSTVARGGRTSAVEVTWILSGWRTNTSGTATPDNQDDIGSDPAHGDLYKG